MRSASALTSFCTAKWELQQGHDASDPLRGGWWNFPSKTLHTFGPYWLLRQI